MLPTADEFAEEARKFKRRSERDRKARLEAEAIAEHGLRELYEKKVQIELLGAIAVAANESTCVEDVLQLALAKICQTTGWALGHAYIVRPAAEGKRLISTGGWYGPETERNRPFRVAFRRAVRSGHRLAWTGALKWKAILDSRSFKRP